MHTVENPPIPFVYPIGNGLQTGSEIILTGATYNGQKKQFAVNLNGEGDNVVLHMNPRFKFLEDTIVLNNRTYAGWQKEERHRNRFSVGDTFRLRIVCHHSHFLIVHNDKEIAQFEHRLSPQMVRSLEVNGDVVLHRVNFVNMAPPPAQPYQSPPPSYQPQPAYQPYPQPGFAPSPPQPGFAPPAPGYPPPMDGPSGYPPLNPAPNFPSVPRPQWETGSQSFGPSVDFGQPQPNANVPYPQQPPHHHHH